MMHADRSLEGIIGPFGSSSNPSLGGLVHLRPWLQFPELSSSMMLCSALHLTRQWECHSLSVVLITLGDPLTESGKSPQVRQPAQDRMGNPSENLKTFTFCSENSRVQNGAQIYWFPEAEQP